MEGCCRDREIESFFLQRPVFESTDIHFCLRMSFQVVAGNRGQILAELDAEYAVTAPGEGHRGLARTTTYLQYSPCWSYSGERDNVVEELLRISRTHLVVERGRFVEGRPEPVPVAGQDLELAGVPQQGKPDEQNSGVTRKRDDGIGETGLLDYQRTEPFSCESGDDSRGGTQDCSRLCATSP